MTYRVEVTLASLMINTQECTDSPQPNQVDLLQHDQLQSETNNMKNRGFKVLRNPKLQQHRRAEIKVKDNQVREEKVVKHS